MSLAQLADVNIGGQINANLNSLTIAGNLTVNGTINGGAAGGGGGNTVGPNVLVSALPTTPMLLGTPFTVDVSGNYLVWWSVGFTAVSFAATDSVVFDIHDITTNTPMCAYYTIAGAMSSTPMIQFGATTVATNLNASHSYQLISAINGAPTWDAGSSALNPVLIKLM